MKKIQSIAENILLPLLLAAYALLLVNQGITVTDTGYNYGNFVNFDSLDGMWKFSTYLATALGAFFTRLPYGHTMLGMNVYTGFVKILIALIAYFVCVRVFRMKKSLAFTAELAALGYCWCPTALLYNYCTYLLFNLGAILLCIAVKKGKNHFYVLAGVCLGLNVLVRLPNLAEMALIAALWFYCIIRRESFGETARRTALCAAGYGLGIGGVLAYISVRYGIGAYFKGIRELLEMPGEAGGYSLKNMILGDIDIYLYHMRWLFPALGFVAAGMAIYAVCRGRYLRVKRCLYVGCNILLIFLYRRLGLFQFVYSTYEGVYSVGSFFLIISGLLGLYVMFFGGEDYELRMHAAVMGVIILVTPLGSNNYLFTAVNNLFWVMPFVLQSCRKLVVKVPRTFDSRGIFSSEPLKITLAALVLFVCVQGVLFGSVFVFRDGMGEDKRDVKITEIAVLKGMYTTADNAEALNSLHAYLEQEELENSGVILYQDIPALAYYMNLRPAISSTWPDLDSYSVDKFRQELERIKMSGSGEKPILILGCSPDAEGAKPELLREFMDELDYELTFCNEKWLLYR